MNKEQEEKVFDLILKSLDVKASLTSKSCSIDGKYLYSGIGKDRKEAIINFLKGDNWNIQNPDGSMFSKEFKQKLYYILGDEINMLNGQITKITKEELLENLNELKEYSDFEYAHLKADELLLDYINDKEITQAFEQIEKQYA